MKYIYGISRRNVNILKQKVKLESKKITDLGELYIDYLLKSENENARLQRRLYYSFDFQIGHGRIWGAGNLFYTLHNFFLLKRPLTLCTNLVIVVIENLTSRASKCT